MQQDLKNWNKQIPTIRTFSYYHVTWLYSTTFTYHIALLNTKFFIFFYELCNIHLSLIFNNSLYVSIGKECQNIFKQKKKRRNRQVLPDCFTYLLEIILIISKRNLKLPTSMIFLTEMECSILKFISICI